MWLCKQLTTRSLPDIGRRFGGRDHTTVLHAVRKIEELKAVDAPIAADVEALMKKLRG
jgi:chromosomal replication initiator protein